ncbi:MAG: hypothetical protein KDK45_00250 [Leptospiraceae bacterium]|nr:hypothetical protein [Leptospiraceae bacterium]
MENAYTIVFLRDTPTVKDTLKRVYNARIRKTKTGYRLRVQPAQNNAFRVLLSKLESDSFIRIVRNRGKV